MTFYEINSEIRFDFDNFLGPVALSALLNQYPNQLSIDDLNS
jgi:hypothetical protein